MQVANRAKNFKEVKRQAQQRNSNKENYSTVLNTGSPLGTLSFKKLDTQRTYTDFVSPPKQLTISARPIETINFSNKKAEPAVQFRQPMHREPQHLRSKDNQRDVSISSNRSNTSEKQGLFKRFSQLAECTSKEKDQTRSHQICFQRILSQKETEASRLYQLPIQPTHSEQYLAKPAIKTTEAERFSHKPRTAKEKVGEYFLRPSLNVASSPKASQLQPTKLKESMQSEFDQVNMSRQSVEGLDMSPYFC